MRSPDTVLGGRIQPLLLVMVKMEIGDTLPPPFWFQSGGTTTILFLFPPLFSVPQIPCEREVSYLIQRDQLSLYGHRLFIFLFRMCQPVRAYSSVMLNMQKILMGQIQHLQGGTFSCQAFSINRSYQTVYFLGLILGNPLGYVSISLSHFLQHLCCLICISLSMIYCYITKPASKFSVL